jgi:hypothetical protein
MEHGAWSRERQIRNPNIEIVMIKEFRNSEILELKG